MAWEDFDDDGPDYSADRDASILWARDLLGKEGWVIFDTETTGLRGAEIVQIGLLWPDGTTALDSLVCPALPIPAQATAIHGITDAMCANAPTLAELLPQMAEAMHGREVVIYNKGFDLGTLYNQIKSLINYRAADDWIVRSAWTCAMEPYSAFVGDRNDYHGNYRWQKLPSAGHTAIGDCRATLDVIREMAGALTSKELHGE